MTCEHESSIGLKAMELISAQGFEGMGEVFQVLLNEAMKIERAGFLQAHPYERTQTRIGHANGYKPKHVETRVGGLDLAVPQTRGGEFYPSALERGLRSERALTMSLAEMYVQGVSTRQVKEITEKLCGFEVTSAQVSRATQSIDESLQKWRERPLGETKYLILDARYEKIRQGGCVVDCAVLVGYGIDLQGHRRILGVSIALSEAEAHWRIFLESLLARGMHGIQMVTSDAHSGLKAALRAVLPSVPWQRCHFHLQQNAHAYVTKQVLKRPVARDIADIFKAPNKEEAERFLQMVVTKYAKEQPGLSNWLESNLREGFTVFSAPPGHWIRLRTSNMAERINQEIKRRTSLVRVFPNVASCERLVTAILMEIDEDWQTGKSYLSMDEV